MVDALPFIQRGVMCQQLIGDLKHTKKINVILHGVVIAFLGAGNSWKT